MANKSIIHHNTPNSIVKLLFCYIIITSLQIVPYLRCDVCRKLMPEGFFLQRLCVLTAMLPLELAAECICYKKVIISF